MLQPLFMDGLLVVRMTPFPRPYLVTIPLALVVLLGITACGPGAQVLEQQQRQITENQRVLNENRQRIQAEKDRRAQQQQPTPEELLEENRLLIIAEQERLDRERQHAQDQQPDTAAALFAAYALALRTDGVAGGTLAGALLAGMPGATPEAEPFPLWTTFFENTVVKLGRLRSPRPVALYYNPLLDVALFTLWEQSGDSYRVVSVRALPGEKLADREVEPPPRPTWLAVQEEPLEALVRTTATRLAVFRSAHPSESRTAGSDGVTFAAAAADLRAALPRLAWSLAMRAAWSEEDHTWLLPVLEHIDTVLTSGDVAAITTAAPATDAATAAALADLPQDFAEHLALDLTLDTGETERLLVGSSPADGDVYVLALCRLVGDGCLLQRFMLLSLSG